MGNRWGKSGNYQTLFWGAPKSLQMVITAMKLKDAYSLKIMTKLDSKLKSKDIIFPTKFCLGKSMIFPMVMYGCESWTVKKAKCWKTDAFELWCWSRLLRIHSPSSPCSPTSPSWRRSVLDVHWKNWYCGWNSNILATAWEELSHWKRPWCWERLGAGGEGDYRGWDGWMASPIQWSWIWVNSGSWWWTGTPCIVQFMGSQTVGQSDWTELKGVWSRPLGVCKTTVSGKPQSSSCPLTSPHKTPLPILA